MFDKKHEEKNAGTCMVLFLPKFDQHFRSYGTCNLDKLYLPHVVRFSLRSEHGYCEISQVLVKVLKCYARFRFFGFPVNSVNMHMYFKE